ncbi:MAG: energy-coupling factor transporter transmembrane protein EcfT [Anaerolineales bacterium]|nr:energy-coupling factor transporter transmembrane protein EcfT [Anaerolineales bacterium]
MLVTWRYRFRDSFIEKFDPRARWFASFMIMIGIIQFWDIRFLLFFFAISMTQFFLTKLTWQETKRAWLFILLLVVVVIGANALLTGRGGPGIIESMDTHIFWEKIITVPLTNWKITINITDVKIAFAASQMVRMLSIAVLFLIIPWTMDPSLYGVTFGGMGIPYRFAFSMDLAFRFVPSLARDFQVTLDSQRARGYEIEKLEGGIFTMLRKIAPLIVPVTMNSIVSGEDIINAMDLRCFGLKKRTWIGQLTYTRRDYVLLAFAGIIMVTSIVFNIMGIGAFWVPAWLTALT